MIIFTIEDTKKPHFVKFVNLPPVDKAMNCLQKKYHKWMRKSIKKVYIHSLCTMFNYQVFRNNIKIEYVESLAWTWNQQNDRERYV